MSRKKKIMLIVGVVVLLGIFALVLYINREKLVVVADVTHTTEDVYLDYLFDEVSEVEGIAVDNVNFDGLTFNERINYAIDKVKASLIVAYASSKEMKMFAENYKDVTFITLGSLYEEELDNLVGVKYDMYNAGYLLGYLAGSSTVTNNLGIIGTDEKINEELVSGFSDGALTANNSVIITVDYMGKETYFNGYYQNKSEDLEDTELARRKANSMYDSGIDIIFDLANNSSEGIIKSAEENDKYVISDCMDKSDNIIACYERDITYGLNEIVKDYNNKNLKNNYTFNINDGVNITIFDKISKEVKEKIESLEKEM